MKISIKYDGNGWSNGTAFPSSDITGANVFTSGSSFEETLNAVSFYTMTDNQKYTVKFIKTLLVTLLILVHLQAHARYPEQQITADTTQSSFLQSCTLSTGKQVCRNNYI